MKKILAAVMAVSMLACFGGCSNNNAPAAPENTDAATSAAAEAVAADTTAAETTAAETTTTAAETAAEETNAAAPTAAAEGESLTAAVMRKMTEWKDGNIIIDANVSEDGTEVSIYMNTYGDKSVMDMNIIGMFRTKTITDGTTTYMINDVKKTYCISTNSDDSNESNPVNDLMISEEYAVNVTDTGKETIDGKEYTYEEFEEDGQKIRYYFDEKGNMLFVGAEDEGEMKTMSFSVTFLDSPDESVFAVPEGYEQISEEDMAMQLFESMFGALGELSGDTGDDSADSASEE